MSFLLDRALDFATYGPFGSRPSPEEARLQNRLNKAAQEYRRIIMKWRTHGVSENAIREAGLWDDWLMQPHVTQMGGGPGGSGIGFTVPTFIAPENEMKRHERTDPAYVVRTEHLNERVQETDTRAQQVGITEGRPLENFIRSGGGGSISSNVISFEMPEPESKGAAPVSEWERILPGFRRRPNGYYLNTGAERWFNTGLKHTEGSKKGKRLTDIEIRQFYKKAVEAAGGTIVDNNILRNLFSSITKKGTGLTDEQTGKTKNIKEKWKNMSDDQRHQMLDILINAGYIPTRDSGPEQANVIRGNRELLIRILRDANALYPSLFGHRVEARDAPFDPGPEVEPSTLEWIESKLDYIRDELKNSGMDQALARQIVTNIQEWARIYGGVLRGENPQLSSVQTQSLAVVNLLTLLRRSLSAQHSVDHRTVVNFEQVIHLARFILSALPAVRAGVIAGAPEASRNIDKMLTGETIQKAAKQLGEYIKKKILGSNDDLELRGLNAQLVDISEVVRDANEIADAINSMQIPQEEAPKSEIQPEDLSMIADLSQFLKNPPEHLKRSGIQARLSALTDATSRVIAQQAASGNIAVRISTWFGRFSAGTRRENAHERKVRINEEKERLAEAEAKAGAAEFEREELKNERRLSNLRQEIERRQSDLSQEEWRINQEFKHDLIQAEDQYQRRQRVIRSHDDRLYGEEKMPVGGAGGGGGPPDDGPPGGGRVALFEVDGRHYVTPRAQFIRFITRIGSYIWALKGKILGGITLSSLAAWIKTVVEAFDSGEEIVIDVANNNVTGITKNKTGNKTVSTDHIEPIGNATIPATGMDNATYEMGIDGKPKLFPQPENALAFHGTLTNNSVIPWAPKAPRWTIMAPKITEPGGTITEKDQLGGFDTENEDITQFMSDRPDLGDKILTYNEKVDEYNMALEANKRTRADQLRNELRFLGQEISGEAANTDAVAGLGKSVKDLPHPVYNGTSISGESATYYAHKDKNERTARLGLDKKIDEYNYLAEKLNDDTYQERTPLANVLHEFKTLGDQINAIEVEPEYAIGQGRAKYISSKYPDRVQELANRTLANEDVELSQKDEQLLKQYPEIGDPVLKIAEAKKHFPSGAPISKTGPELEKLSKFQSQSYKLPQSRPFAEGKHKLPPELIRLVHRISNQNEEAKRNFIVTKEEREALERFPDLKQRVLAYEEAVNALPKARPGKSGRPMYTALTPDQVNVTDVDEEIQAIKDSGFYAEEAPEYSMAELDERLQNANREYQNALMNFEMGRRSGATRSDLYELYNKYNLAKSRLDAIKKDASGRGTFLADRSRELLPRNEQELERFNQLQALEAAFQENPDVLLEYNHAIEDTPMGILGPMDYYEYRMKLLRDAAAKVGVSDKYEESVRLAGQPDNATIVNIPDDAAATERQGEGTERANVVDPDEANLFMMSGAQNRKQFQNWLKFSYVPPGHGLGGPSQNKLQKQEVLAEARRYAKAKDVPMYSRKPLPRPHENPMRAQQWINPNVSNFGKVHMKDAFHDNYLDMDSKRVIWSNPYGNINSTRDVRRSESIYDPDYTDFRYDELTGTRYGRHPVFIGEVSKPGEYRFTGERYYDTNGFNYKQQNVLNLFPPEGEQTMITKDRAGLGDRGIVENRSTWNTYGKTRLRPIGAPGFRSTKF